MQDSLERRVFRNTPRLLLIFIAAGTVASLALRAVRGAEPTVVTLGLRALLAGAEVFLWCWAGLTLVLFGCAAASLLSTRLFGQVASATTHRLLAAVVVLAFVAFFMLVPMCFGSLAEGTYDCITLYARASAALGGG